MHHLPQPYDAIQVDQFHPSGHGRGFLGTTRQVERIDIEDTIEVQISGVQFSDGCIERWALLRNAGGPMTPAESRQLARQLIAAADEIQLYAQEGI